jgi:hypothetical protein
LADSGKIDMNPVLAGAIGAAAPVLAYAGFKLGNKPITKVIRFFKNSPDLIPLAGGVAASAGWVTYVGFNQDMKPGTAIGGTAIAFVSPFLAYAGYRLGPKAIKAALASEKFMKNAKSVGKFMGKATAGATAGWTLHSMAFDKDKLIEPSENLFS